MNIADVLRRLAATIDGHPQGGSPDPGVQNPAELISVPTGQHTVVVDQEEETVSPQGETPAGNDKNPEDLFLPPLQQKQELLKKAVGVENVYDDGTATQQYEAEKEQDDDSGEEDQLERIKKLSGVPVAAIQELSNDAPLDD